jgi:V8-like Glu-specific endopeptidase
MDWTNNLINLRDILADLYLFKEESVRVVREAGLKPSLIKFQNSAIDNWHYILDFARHDAASIDRIIDVAIKEFPGQKTSLEEAKSGQLTGVRGKDIAKDVQWKQPIDGAKLEKIIGKQSTLLPISFLELGMTKARAVVRVKLEGASGSGFLTRGRDKQGQDTDILVTNNHVIENKASCAAAVAQLNYQRTAAGLDATATEYAFDAKRQFATSLDDDWTAVAVKPGADGRPASAAWGWLKLAQQNPQIEDFSIIIQHPSGGPKQIALYHNVIAYVDDKVVQYLTDTEPGSSGSPVFDTHWNVIALHHSGGWLREPTGDPKQTFYRNEGINKVLEGLAARGILGGGG